jgi:hypothetical protein
MSDEVTIKDAATAVAQSKALLAAIIAAFTLMSAVGIAILEWRVDVHVKAALASQDIGTDAKIVDMDKNIATNAAKSERNREVIEDNKKRVEQAFAVLLDRDD